MMTKDELKSQGVTELNATETKNTFGGGWLTTLIGAAFTILGNWFVSQLNGEVMD